MKNYSIIYKRCECYNELICLNIKGKKYFTKDLSQEAIDLLTAITYNDNDNHKHDLELFINISQMIGFEKMVKGLRDIKELGANIISDSLLRELIILKNKKKFKGLMRSMLQ